MSVRLGWAIVEVMGHRRYVGEIEETTLAGAPVLRVYVPAHQVERREVDWREDESGRSQQWIRTATTVYPEQVVDLGGAALFAVTRVPEETARRDLPLTYHATDGAWTCWGEWTTAARRLPGPVEEAEEVDDGDLVTRQDEGADDLDDASELGDA